MASSQKILTFGDPSIKLFERLLDNCGPRAPCSPNEKQAADLLRQELDTFADKTTDE